MRALKYLGLLLCAPLLIMVVPLVIAIMLVAWVPPPIDEDEYPYDDDDPGVEVDDVCSECGR